MKGAKDCHEKAQRSIHKNKPCGFMMSRADLKKEETSEKKLSLLSSVKRWLTTSHLFFL